MSEESYLKMEGMLREIATLTRERDEARAVLVRIGDLALTHLVQLDPEETLEIDAWEEIHGIARRAASAAKGAFNVS